MWPKYIVGISGKGQPILKTKEGDRMDCEWVSHLPDVQGTVSDAGWQNFPVGRG
jgi:hypothetical protein